MIQTIPNPLQLGAGDRVKIKGDPCSPTMTIIGLGVAEGGAVLAACLWFNLETLQPYSLQLDTRSLEREAKAESIIQ